MTKLAEAVPTLNLADESSTNIVNHAHDTKSLDSGLTLETSPAPLNRCTLCDQPAISHCKDCKDAHGFPGHELTYYCGKVCQTEHWAAHKALCNIIRNLKPGQSLPDVKRLFRAASVLQDIFYLQQEIEFQYQRVDEVVHQYDTISVYDKEPGIGATKTTEQFPENFFENTTIKNACLSYMGCSNAVAWQCDLTRTVLKGLATCIEEVQFWPRNKKLEMARFLSNDRQHSSSFLHTILRITLRDGSQYAWDMSAAQFGRIEPVSLWSRYERHKFLMKYSEEEHGTTVQQFLTHYVEGREYASGMRYRDIFAQFVQLWVDKFVSKHHGGNMVDFFQQDHLEFEKGKRELLKVIKEKRNLLLKPRPENEVGETVWKLTYED